jgi:hypothetical protein
MRSPDSCWVCPDRSRQELPLAPLVKRREERPRFCGDIESCFRPPARYYATYPITEHTYTPWQAAFVPAGSGPVAGSRTCSHPIISTMDDCLLQALRGLLRLEAHLENAHFAGRAGAVMEGGGLKASFGAGCSRVGFAAATTPLGQSALASFLKSLLFRPRVFLLRAERLAIRELQRRATRRLRRAVRRGSRHILLEQARNWLSQRNSFTTRKGRRYQVSAPSLVRRSGTATPTNHHLEALGPPISRAARGFLVCRREPWRRGSRARPVCPPRIARGVTRQTGCGAGTISDAQPSPLCGGGSFVCRQPLLVLLLCLLPAPLLRRSFERLWAHGVPRPRGQQSSDRVDLKSIDDESGEGPHDPLDVVWAMPGKQRRTGRRNAPGSDAGRSEQRQFSSV